MNPSAPDFGPAPTDPTVAGRPEPVLLYDGTCGLCNAIVRALIRADPDGRLRFAPLQSGPGQAYLRAQGLPTADFDTLVLVPDWRNPEGAAPVLRSAGALAAADAAGGRWRALLWLRLWPGPWRDAAYRLVARFRYRIFGEYHPSPLPDPAWEKRFLAR